MKGRLPRRPHPASRFLPALLSYLAAAAACADGGDGGADAGHSCVVRDVAVLPVLNQVGSPIVRVAVNGKPVAVVIATGANISTIGTDDAAALDVPISFDDRHFVTGIGGSVSAPNATIHELSIGTAVARNVGFSAIDAHRGQIGGLKVVGLFGGNFLANYDVEIDLPAHHVGLYTEQDHCGRHFAPWNGPFYEQPFDLKNGTEIDFSITVNDRRIDVQLDSGATRTVLTSDDATAAGATEAAMAGDRWRVAVGIDGSPVAGHMHRFDDVAIGPEHLSPRLLPRQRRATVAAGRGFPAQSSRLDLVPARDALYRAGDGGFGIRTGRRLRSFAWLRRRPAPAGCPRAPAAARSAGSWCSGWS